MVNRTANAYGDNVQSADNQQERLDGYIAGYVDGEGSFSVTVNRNPTSRFKLQLVPELHVSQNGDRREVLDLIQKRLGCGYIKRNGRKDRVMVFVVRRREDLLTKSSHSLSETRSSHQSKGSSRLSPLSSERWQLVSTSEPKASVRSWSLGCP